MASPLVAPALGGPAWTPSTHRRAAPKHPARGEAACKTTSKQAVFDLIRSWQLERTEWGAGFVAVQAGHKPSARVSLIVMVTHAYQTLRSRPRPFEFADTLGAPYTPHQLWPNKLSKDAKPHTPLRSAWLRFLARVRGPKQSTFSLHLPDPTTCPRDRSHKARTHQSCSKPMQGSGAPNKVVRRNLAHIARR